MLHTRTKPQNTPFQPTEENRHQSHFAAILSDDC